MLLHQQPLSEVLHAKDVGTKDASTPYIHGKKQLITQFPIATENYYHNSRSMRFNNNAMARGIQWGISSTLTSDYVQQHL